MALAPRLVLAAVLVSVTLTSASRRGSMENEIPNDRDDQILIPEHNAVVDNGLPGLHFYTHDNVSVVMDCIMAMNAAYRHELLASKWEKVLYTCQTRDGSAHFRSRRAAPDPNVYGTVEAAPEALGANVWESRKFPTEGGEAAEEELSHPTLDTLGIRLRRSRYDSGSGRRRPDPSHTSPQEHRSLLTRIQPRLPSEERRGQRKGDETNLEPPVTQGRDNYDTLPGVEAQERDYKAPSHGYKGQSHDHKGPSHGYDHKAPSYKPIPYKGPSYGPYDFQPKGKATFSKKGKYGDDPVAESQKSKYNRPYYDEPQSYFGGFGGGGTSGYKGHGGGGGGYGKGHGGGGGGYGKGHGGGGGGYGKGHGGGGGGGYGKGHGGGGGGGYGKGHGGGGGYGKGHGGGGGGGYGKGHGGGGGYGKGHGGGGGGGYGKGHVGGGGGYGKGHGGDGYGHQYSVQYHESDYKVPSYKGQDTSYGFTEDSPTYDYSEQSYEAPAPSYEAPASSYEAPAPSYEAPAPSYEAPAPSYEAPAPSYEAPAPSYEAPAPSYEAPAPSYEAPAPSYEAPAPSYEAPAPSYEAPTSNYDSPYTSHKGPSSGISYEVLDDPYNTYNAHDDVSLKKVEDSYSHLRTADGGRPAYIGVTEMLSTNPYESVGEARTVITTRQPKGEGVRGEGPRGTALHSQPSNPFPSAYPTNLKPQNLRPFDNIFGNFDDVFDGSFAGST
ncbi:hornerin-like [Penaeus chinensis]|uniref:hornerin-like n=1 Tax=Penaeus chinensis TaxID=139456 RepID=UPI001FB58FA3|nr:hornerin-like [Penaeus chinensis]